MKDKLISLAFGFAFILGLSMVLYPTISNLYNNYGHHKVINQYDEQVSQYGEETYKEEKEKAISYNQLIASQNDISGTVSKDFKYSYDELLDVGGISVMGVLEIPIIKVELPIYHGTEQSALQVGVGHYEGSSLPVGGASTHSVLTGHTGLPESKLFTDIDQLQKKDIFYIRVLNEILAYEVDDIKVVLPEEVQHLNIVEGKDCCTLVTCTPYGINSHRLLVRGKRIEYVSFADESLKELQILPLVFAVLASVIVYMLCVMFKTKFRKKG